MVGAPESGRMEGQHAAYGDGHSHGSTEENPLGTERTDGQREKPFDENATLNEIIERIIERHNANRILLKSKKTYTDVFKNFVRVMNLEDVTLRVLKKNLKPLVLAYLNTKEKCSYHKLISGLKSCCEYGLEIPWPISMKRDIGRLPRTRIKVTPRDAVIDGWLKKLPLVDDPYDRLFLGMHFEYGFRSHSHFAYLRWRHILWEIGEPTRIIAQDDAFKTTSPIVADIPPYLRDLIKRWHDATSFKSDDDWIFPWRSLKGWIGTIEYEGKRRHVNLAKCREYSRASIRDYWRGLQRRLNAPALSPGRCRAWCKTTMRRAGVPWKLIEIRQGRDPQEPYDECNVDDDIADLRKLLPNGILGFHGSTENQIVDGVPSQWIELYPRLMRGEVKPSEIMDLVFELQQKAKSQLETRI